MKERGLGRHLLIEAYGCDVNSLSDVEGIQTAFHEAALAAGMTIINECYHRFEPWGVSGMTVVAESHLAVHTWPEYRYAAIDVFVCGDDVDPNLACDRLKAHFQWDRVEINSQIRGVTTELNKVLV